MNAPTTDSDDFEVIAPRYPYLSVGPEDQVSPVEPHQYGDCLEISIASGQWNDHTAALVNKLMAGEMPGWGQPPTVGPTQT